MKRILLLLNILLMFFIASCKEPQEVDNRELLEKFEEYTKESNYICYKSTIDELEEYFEYYSLQYYTREAIILNLEGLSNDVWVYSFENGTDVEEVKNHLISHTVSELKFSLKYAVYDELLFITPRNIVELSQFLKIIPLQFEEGKVDFSKKIQVEKVCAGSNAKGILEGKTNFKIFKSYKDFAPLKEELVNTEGVDGTHRFYETELEMLKSYNASDFESKNLILIQICNDHPFPIHYIPTQSPTLHINSEGLEIRSLIGYPMLDSNLYEYNYFYIYLIDKDISFSQMKHTFYDYKTGIDFPVSGR